MKRSTRFIVGGIFVAVALAVGLVLVTRNGGTSRPSSEAGPLPTEPALVPIGTLIANVLSNKTPPSDFLTSVSKPRPVKTRNPEYYTNTVDAAIRRAAQQLTGEAGVVTRVRLDSVSYVQTTAVQALTLFSPSYLSNLTSYGMTRDTPVWAFLALGAFRPASWDRVQPSAGIPDALPAMWVVVPQGGYDFALGDPVGKIPDLTTLGKPIEIKRGQAPGTDLDTVRAPGGGPLTPTACPGTDGSTAICVTSAGASVGGNVAVGVYLYQVPAPGQTGYGFDMEYPAGLTLVSAGTTAACIDGEGGIPPSAGLGAGPHDYAAGCSNVPSPGTAHADCGGATGCTLATAVFTCSSAGVYTLDITTDGSAAYASAGTLTAIAGANVHNGTVTCT